VAAAVVCMVHSAPFGGDSDMIETLTTEGAGSGEEKRLSCCDLAPVAAIDAPEIAASNTYDC
jgi:hypothetical protein